MKTKLSFSSLMSYVVNYLVSAALISGPSLSLAAGEVVKSTANTSRGKVAKTENVPTPEEINMGAVKSPYKACEGVVIVERSERPTGSTKSGRTPAQIEWDKKDEFWKNYPGKGCDASKVNCTRKVQYIPDTHFYKTFDGTPRASLSGKESANDFLVRVAAASTAKVKARIEELKKQKACLEAGTGDCMKSYTDRMAILKAKMPEFRLSVARFNDKSDELLSRSGTMPLNGGIIVMKDFSEAEDKMVVPRKMPELSKEERSTLVSEMNALFERAQSEHKAELEKEIKAQTFASKTAEDEYRQKLFAKGQPNMWIKPQMDAQKEKARESYNKLLAEFPELGYVNEGDLNAKTMPAKLADAIKDAEETMQDMKKAGETVTSKPGAVSDKRLSFAAHSQTIEEMLAAEGDGHSCAVAAATLNELGTVRTRDGAIVGGVSLLASLTLGIGGGMAVRGATAIGLVGETGAVVAGHAVGAMAFAAGAVPGVIDSVHSVQDIDTQARDARVGIVKPEEANKALEGKAGTIAMSFLNLQGSGHAVGALAGVAVGTTGALSRFMLANSAKAAGKGGGGAAGKEGLKVIADIAKAEGGDKAAAAALAKAAAAEEKRVLGTVTDADREQLAKVVATGLVGTAKEPDAATLKVVANNLAGMQGPNKAEYVEAVADLRKSTPISKVDPAREAAVNEAIANVAGVVPTAEAKKILADPAWDAPALTGWAAVVAKMREFKGSTQEKFEKAWESLRVKAGLAKEKTEDILGRCRCGGICPMPKIAGPYDGNPWGEVEGKVMACAAPLSSSL